MDHPELPDHLSRGGSATGEETAAQVEEHENGQGSKGHAQCPEPRPEDDPVRDHKGGRGKKSCQGQTKRSGCLGKGPTKLEKNHGSQTVGKNGDGRDIGHQSMPGGEGKEEEGSHGPGENQPRPRDPPEVDLPQDSGSASRFGLGHGDSRGRRQIDEGRPSGRDQGVGIEDRPPPDGPEAHGQGRKGAGDPGKGQMAPAPPGKIPGVDGEKEGRLKAQIEQAPHQHRPDHREGKVPAGGPGLPRQIDGLPKAEKAENDPGAPHRREHPFKSVAGRS